MDSVVRCVAVHGAEKHTCPQYSKTDVSFELNCVVAFTKGR